MITRDTPGTAMAVALRKVVGNVGFGERFGGALVIGPDDEAEVVAAILEVLPSGWCGHNPETVEHVREAMSRAGCSYDSEGNQTTFGGNPDEVAARLRRSLARRQRDDAPEVE